MALAALNDLAMIKLETKRFGGAEKDTAESGILISLPEKMTYLGFWSFAFENSYGDTKGLEDIHKYWSTQIGKKVFWTALAERGNIIEKNGEKYAFLKLTSLIAVDDADSDARSVHSDGAGSFGMEQ